MNTPAVSILVAAALVLCPAVTTAGTPVSYIDFSTKKEIMIVDGKPFFYTAAQISTFRLLDNDGFTWANIEQVFQAAADTGFTTVGVTVLWNKVEASEGRYDWSSIDIPIGYAAKRGLKVEIIYVGSDFCGGYPIPEYVSQAAQRILKRDGSVARSNGTDKLDKTDPNLLRREQHFLTQLFNHIRTFTDARGYPNTVVGVQLLNESMAAKFFGNVSVTDRSYSSHADAKWKAGGYSSAEKFNADVLWEYIEGLARAVKTSDYSVWTRSNFVCSWEGLCERLVVKNEARRKANGTAWDFIGSDPYVDTPASVLGYCTTGGVARGRNLPMVMENAGKYANTAQLLFAALAGDCRYHVWEMNSSINYDDFGNDMGLYSTNWSAKTIAPKRHVAAVRSMLEMLNKDKADLAALQAGSSRLKFFNQLSERAADYTEKINRAKIRFVTQTGAGAVIAARDDSYIFLSAGRGRFYVPASMKIASLEAGYFDADNEWVGQRQVPYTTAAKRKFFDIDAYEAIRLGSRN